MKALSIVNEWLLSLRLIEADVPIVPWRLARTMSCLGPGDAFLHRLLAQYRADPGFGVGLEGAAPARLQLAAAVFAGRVGATKVAETILSVGSQIEHRGQGHPARAGPRNVVGILAVVISFASSRYSSFPIHPRLLGGELTVGASGYAICPATTRRYSMLGVLRPADQFSARERPQLARFI